MIKRVMGIVILATVAASQAAWVLVDDVDTYDNSSGTLIGDGITYDAAVGQDVWTGIPAGTSRVHIYDDDAAGDQSLAAYGGTGWRGAAADLKNNFTQDHHLVDGDTATYFFQFMTEGDSFDCMFGLVERTATLDENNSWEDYSVMPFIAGGQLKVYGDTMGDTAVTPINSGQWYNVWLVVDNSAKTFDIHWSTGTTNASLGLSGVEFGRITDPVDLEVFAFTQNLSDTVHVDNLYRASGEDTTFPSTNIVVEPPPPNLDNVGGALAGVTNDPVYLMCYHEGYYPAGGNSGVFLSWSTNGYDFSTLNNGHPVFVPPEFPGDDADNADGYENLVRDPSIIYGPDGLFHLVYTSDISSRSFGYAESPDLINWSNIKLVQIWEDEPESVGHTWAPEIFYDEDLNQYMIAFSSNVGGNSIRMYYTTTTDFTNFSSPQVLFWNTANPTGEQIDGFVAKVGNGHYLMAYKDNAQTWILDSSSPYGPWANARQASAGGDEGPALIRIGDTWHLYYDNYGQGDNVFGLGISTDTTNWADVTALADMPQKSDVPDYGYDGGPPHHSTVFAAPLSSLGAFVEPYQDNVTNLTSLVYRWSFDEPAGSVSSGTMVTDSVSGVTAVIIGNRAGFTGSGLELPGDTDATGDAAYIDLPNDIISSMTNLTLEIWATPVASKNWQRLFSFGRTAEAGSGDGEWPGPASGYTEAANTMYWTLNVGSDLNKQNCAIRDSADDLKDAVTGTCMNTVAGTRYHYVFTFEDGTGFFGAAGGRMTLYRDGYRIGWRDVSFRLQDIDDVNNWLGRSQWSGDSNSNVEYDEVRIYSEVLSWYDIYGHRLAGPDVTVVENPLLNLDISGGVSALIWPGNAVGYALKNATELSASNVWATVTNTVGNSTNGLFVTLPLPADKEFYRLEK